MREILKKFHAIYFKRRAIASDLWIKCRRIMEVGQPFEPQVQLWLDRLHYSAGISPKVHDVIALKKEVDGTAKEKMGR